ncbi:MAG: hypothetical protein ACTMIR_08185 [Cellulomonadaceae bacterium]
MNTNRNVGPGADDGLGAAMHDIAGAVPSGPASDDDFVAGVRTRAVAVRRRRSTRRTALAAASIAAVVAVGAVVTQQVARNGPSPAPLGGDPTTDAPWPQCGASVTDIPGVESSGADGSGLRLVSEAHRGADGEPATTGDPAAPWATDLDVGTILPLQLRNDGESPVAGGSTGYAAVVVVSDGVVVAAPGGMPEPWLAFDLAPGESAPLHAARPEPCAGGDLPDGVYQAYALLDATLGDPGTDADQVEALGGPWPIRLGETPDVIATPAEVLGCQASVTELAATREPVSLTLGADNSAVSDQTGGHLEMVLEQTEPESGVRLRYTAAQVALLAEDTVVATASVPLGDESTLLGGAPDEGGVTSARIAVDLPTVGCDGVAVPPGRYTVQATVQLEGVDGDPTPFVIASDRWATTLEETS